MLSVPGPIAGQREPQPLWPPGNRPSIREVKSAAGAGVALVAIPELVVGRSTDPLTRQTKRAPLEMGEIHVAQRSDLHLGTCCVPADAK
ncbi:MAG: hypothetical protein ACI8X5_002420 [Planctomycetota bacterium]|jgi:hypothetical protein